MEQDEKSTNRENSSEHVINSGKVKLKIVALNAKKLNRMQRCWKEKFVTLTENLIEFYINEEDSQNPFEEAELSIPFEKSKIECIEQYKNKVTTPSIASVINPLFHVRMLEHVLLPRYLKRF